MILIMKLQHIVISLVMLIMPAYIMGQSINDVKKWYQEGRVKDAKYALEDMYESTPNNAEVNYYLGVIAFEEGDLSIARKYLEFASQKKITESYLSLGELYSLYYLFDDAEKEFVKYEKAQRRNKDALAKLEEKRDIADRLYKLVGRTEDVQIIDSVVVSKSDFLSAYKLSASSGTLLPVNEFFKNATSNGKPLFMTEREDKIYYSVEDSVRGSKLFTMEKLLDNYGNEKPLPESINQKGDQAYPFVLSDGVTMYFSSTGHGSLGGYDLFVTRYNFNSNTYLAPNQLNMPFNSPFNDYMMVVDEDKGVGWFASDRFQPQDYVCIYTFIPSARVVLIDNDDDKYLAGRAKISSIKDTWDQGKDYSDLLDIARQDVLLEGKQHKDFEFVINDDLTYYTLNDFRHGGARSMFSQALELSSKLEYMNDDLTQKREQFEGGMTNETIRATIISLENQVRDIAREIELLKLRARNEEIRNSY